MYEHSLIAGLDLGKLSDPSALALLDRRRPKLASSVTTSEYRKDPLYGSQTTTTVRRPFTGTLTRAEQRARQWTYRLVRMQCWDVGTDYDEVLQWLVKAYSRSPVVRDDGTLDMRAGGLAGTTLAVDYTGVGVAVVEWLRKELSLAKSRCVVRPIWIQSGRQAVENSAGGWNVPKRELVSAVQVLLGTRRLEIEEQLDNCSALLAEMDNFKVKQNLETGHESFEAWREHEHDDKVLALAICCWVGEQANREFWIR